MAATDYLYFSSPAGNETISYRMSPLTITTTSLPNGTVGTPYTSTLSATGGIPPYTWTIISGSLPNGLSLNSSTGNISGTPTTTETSGFTAQVTDTAGANNSKTLSITIEGNSPGLPDLIVSSLSAPSTTRAGSIIDISDTTTNNGNAVSAISVTRFYLSVDTTIDGNDKVLGNRTVPSLSQGSSSSGTTTMTIPVGTPKGTYNIIAEADSGKIITESNENNNTTYFRIRVR